MTKTFKEGLTVKQMIIELHKLPQDLPVMIARDEEQNRVFKGFYVETCEDCIVMAGLSGYEVE